MRSPRATVSLLLCLCLAASNPTSAQSEEAREAFALTHEYLFAPNKEYPYFERGLSLDAFPSKTFKPSNAAFLAQCSYLIYVEELDFVAGALAKAGFSGTSFFDQAGTFAFLSENADHRILVFRGTQTADWNDYLTDAQVLQKPFNRHGTAHSGFIDALDHVYDDIEQELSARQAVKSKPLWIAGHSLGAALGTLYALRTSQEVAGVYAIGSPRVVGQSLAKQAERKLPIFRITQNNDLIARLPLAPFYRHIGPSYLIDADQRLSIDPSFSERMGSRWKGHRDLIDTLIQKHWKEGDLSAIPSAHFVDHSPRLYCDALIKLALEAQASEQEQPAAPKSAD